VRNEREWLRSEGQAVMNKSGVLSSTCRGVQSRRRAFLRCTKTPTALTLRRMLKTAILDGTQQLWLQQEILEARSVDAHVSLLDLRSRGLKNAA
jgi:hypothetical protein